MQWISSKEPEGISGSLGQLYKKLDIEPLALWNRENVASAATENGREPNVGTIVCKFSFQRFLPCYYQRYDDYLFLLLTRANLRTRTFREQKSYWTETKRRRRNDKEERESLVKCQYLLFSTLQLIPPQQERRVTKDKRILNKIEHRSKFTCAITEFLVTEHNLSYTLCRILPITHPVHQPHFLLLSFMSSRNVLRRSSTNKSFSWGRIPTSLLRILPFIISFQLYYLFKRL